MAVIGCDTYGITDTSIVPRQVYLITDGTDDIQTVMTQGYLTNANTGLQLVATDIIWSNIQGTNYMFSLAIDNQGNMTLNYYVIPS